MTVKSRVEKLEHNTGVGNPWATLPIIRVHITDGENKEAAIKAKMKEEGYVEGECCIIVDHSISVEWANEQKGTDKLTKKLENS